MLKKLGNFMGLAGAQDPASPVEWFGQSKIARQFGEELLRASPARRNHLQGIRDRLTAMTREEKDELVDRIFARLALFVYDLPASENSHHAPRFGLLEHLLEVAHLTARELASPGFQISPEPSINHRERPLWIYAGVIAAIAHDIGKVRDLDVAVPGKGSLWDPASEPLRLFCLRNAMGETGPGIWHHHPRRGMDSHESFTTEILPRILTPEVEGYLGARLASVISALTSTQDWKTASELSRPAKDVVRVVRRMDQESSHGDGKALAEKPREDPRSRTPAARASAPGEPPAAARPAPSFALVARAPSPEPAGETVIEEPAIVPPDFWGEPVPDPRERRGDPVEIERRLAMELDPSRFLDLIRRMVVMRRFSRNNLYTDAYIRPDYVWLVLPRALRRLALINHLPFDTEVLRRMLASLGSSPLVEPADRVRVPVYMKPRPDSNTFLAVRIKTLGFLSSVDQAKLGYHKMAIQAIDPGIFAENAAG
jgi:hypothetical protein